MIDKQKDNKQGVDKCKFNKFLNTRQGLSVEMKFIAKENNVDNYRNINLNNKEEKIKIIGIKKIFNICNREKNFKVKIYES